MQTSALVCWGESASPLRETERGCRKPAFRRCQCLCENAGQVLEGVRQGTSDEIRGVEAVPDVFSDLKAGFDKAGMKVIEDHILDPPDGSIRQAVPEADVEGQARGAPRPRMEEPETPLPAPPRIAIEAEPALPPQELPEEVPPSPPARAVDAPPQGRDSTSSLELEMEVMPQLSELMLHGSAQTAGERRDEAIRAGVQSASCNAALDGVPLTRPPAPHAPPSQPSPAEVIEEGFRPVRRVCLEDNAVNPYMTEQELFAEEIRGATTGKSFPRREFSAGATT